MTPTSVETLKSTPKTTPDATVRTTQLSINVLIRRGHGTGSTTLGLRPIPSHLRANLPAWFRSHMPYLTGEDFWFDSNSWRGNYAVYE